MGGLITHRQRPGTASGVTFLNLEDETGMLNIVCSQSMWARDRVMARTSAGMVIRGMLERHDGVINLVADKLERIEIVYPHRSRDFQ
ncbi:MAG: OB-fold nucleic acid binding domain-containing protein [Aeromicrobium sp.]